MTAQAAHGAPLHAGADTPALKVRGLVSGYDSTTVLHGVDLTVAAGGVVALFGPNGAGKTTLLSSISGLIKPTQGSVELDGEDVSSLSTVERARRGLCLIPEGHAVFRGLTVRENLRLQAPKGDAALAVEQATEAFPVLGRRLDQAAGTMSGGEQQMLALARAYVTSPRLILVDEASLGLAPLVVDVVFEFLLSLVKRGVALVVVDQFIARALEIATYAYVLTHGEIAFHGTPDELGRENVLNTYLATS